MTSITVKSSKGNYPIYVGVRLLEKTAVLVRTALKLKSGGLKNKKVMIVTQAKPARHYLKKVASSLKRQGMRVSVYYLPDGESAKSERELFRLLGVMLKQGFERGDLLLALGGGVVGDLAGFCASVYLRGIIFVNVATTLLAHVDSAIGGKTGINLQEGKNLVGSFYPPCAVILDMTTLRTLPDREIKASLAEVIKYGVIRDAALFRLLETGTRSILKKDLRVLSKVVARCAKIKALVVSRDEKEIKGERMILNFGHTFGHGFEQALGFKKLMHGEAVAAGMVAASDMAVRIGMFRNEDMLRLKRLIHQAGLPADVRRFKLKFKKVMNAMSRDKKKSSGKLRFVLPLKIGKVAVVNDVPSALVQSTLIRSGCCR